MNSQDFDNDLRKKAEDQIELLIAYLDALDGDTDLELYLTGYSDGMDDREGDCEDEGAQCDDEGDIGDSGVADMDGYMEQCPKLFEHSSFRAE